MPTPNHPGIGSLVTSLEGAFRGKGWQGATLTGSLRGITHTDALRVVPPLAHSIWQLVLHAAYWKYAVRRQLCGAAVPPFTRSPANWPRVPVDADAAAWKRDVRLLKDEHEALLGAVLHTAPIEFDRVPPTGRRWTRAQYVAGIAAHDAYHCGQIQLIKRLCRGTR